MGNDDFKVVTQKIRDEAKIWQKRVDDTRPIVSAVQNAWLASTAFFVGDLATLGVGMINADAESKQYNEFRTYIEKLLTGAGIEFGQIDATLRKIADEYDRTESVNKLDLDKTYHV
ncbi:hypothetical protein SK803_19595 [Lentzea sp. BCCO 10_0856]|uniref:Excreted virulence factor EspC, type VII ESX diderm n=1 Tax=Lentzea miocenica TaxID=3095431 RepID=A0ABU4T2U6_9PSEU|nr:hypothetical protein [Lentzea sp. BCCO 10_0856]MDX8032425.1 hypothetical protein [Lentzea sp. BCCO 10_0856]